MKKLFKMLPAKGIKYLVPLGVVYMHAVVGYSFYKVEKINETLFKINDLAFKSRTAVAKHFRDIIKVSML